MTDAEKLNKQLLIAKLKLAIKEGKDELAIAVAQQIRNC